MSNHFIGPIFMSLFKLQCLNIFSFFLFFSSVTFFFWYELWFVFVSSVQNLYGGRGRVRHPAFCLCPPSQLPMVGKNKIKKNSSIGFSMDMTFTSIQIISHFQLLHHSKPIPAVLSSYMLRRTIVLAKCNYELVYRPGCEMKNADLFSQLLLPVTNGICQSFSDVL